MFGEISIFPELSHSFSLVFPEFPNFLRKNPPKNRRCPPQIHVPHVSEEVQDGRPLRGLSQGHLGRNQGIVEMS